MPHLDVNLGGGHVAFVLAGSSGFSLEGMKQRIGGRPKGGDVLSRIPVVNQFVIPAMSFGDRVLITLRQFVEAGRRMGHEIGQVEKPGLYEHKRASGWSSDSQARQRSDGLAT